MRAAAARIGRVLARVVSLDPANGPHRRGRTILIQLGLRVETQRPRARRFTRKLVLRGPARRRAGTSAEGERGRFGRRAKLRHHPHEARERPDRLPCAVERHLRLVHGEALDRVNRTKGMDSDETLPVIISLIGSVPAAPEHDVAGVAGAPDDEGDARVGVGAELRLRPRCLRRWLFGGEDRCDRQSACSNRRDGPDRGDGCQRRSSGGRHCASRDTPENANATGCPDA